MEAEDEYAENHPKIRIAKSCSWWSGGRGVCRWMFFCLGSWSEQMVPSGPFQPWQSVSRLSETGLFYPGSLMRPKEEWRSKKLFYFQHLFFQPWGSFSYIGLWGFFLHTLKNRQSRILIITTWSHFRCYKQWVKKWGRYLCHYNLPLFVSPH